MTRHRLLLGVLSLIALLSAAGLESGAAGADKDAPPKSGGTVSGIVMEKRDASIQVKLDNQEKPVTYSIDRSNKPLLKALGLIFPVARVRLVYKTSSDTQQLVSIRKTGTTGVGTVTGKVLATHGWWVEVKPRKGPPEGYAATYPKEQWKATEEKIKELKKGDTVVISYFTDFERHRITSIRKIGK